MPEKDKSVAQATETASVEIGTEEPDGKGFESGPHLSDEQTRAIKLSQLVSQGLTSESDTLTDDERAILVEYEAEVAKQGDVSTDV
jgi:hypothetical protein